MKTGFDVEEIDHIAIAVPDLDAAVHAATTLLGAKLLWRHPPKERAINDGAVLELGGMLVVLELPLTDRGVFAEFLKRRGPGIHHVGVSVTNLDQAMEDAEKAGARLLNPSLDNPIRREVLVHPKAGLGVLWQMVEWNPDIRPDRERRRNALRNGEFVVPGLS
jgi:methylmalonyl-CoA epimerase